MKAIFGRLVGDGPAALAVRAKIEQYLGGKMRDDLPDQRAGQMSLEMRAARYQDWRDTVASD